MSYIIFVDSLTSRINYIGRVIAKVAVTVMPFLVYIVLPVAVICFTLYVVRVRRILRFHGGPLVYYSDVTLHGKTVLVTGGNTGIGKETALDLASRGARVIIACRDLVKAENAAKEIRKMTGNESVATVHLDLADLESVKKMSHQILKNETRYVISIIPRKCIYICVFIIN